MFVGLFLAFSHALAEDCDAKKVCGPLTVLACEDPPGSGLPACDAYRAGAQDRALYTFACSEATPEGSRSYFCRLSESKERRGMEATRQSILREMKPSDYALKEAPPPSAPLPPRCEDESACSSREVYVPCEAGAPCTAQDNPDLPARRVCEREGFTAWCVREPDVRESSGCFCAHGSPVGTGIVGFLALALARKRRQSRSA